jgi:hypothetical protein
MLQLRGKNSRRNEASCRLSKIPDPLRSLPEAGLAPALHWSLRSCRKCGTTSSDAIYHWLGELPVQCQSCLTSSLACEA